MSDTPETAPIVKEEATPTETSTSTSPPSSKRPKLDMSVVVEEQVHDAVEHLLEQKVRASRESICRVVSRRCLVSEAEVLEAVERLLVRGDLLSIDYKGKRSFRNRKHQSTSHRRSRIVNPEPVSRALKELFYVMMRPNTSSSSSSEGPLPTVPQTFNLQSILQTASTMPYFSRVEKDEMMRFLERECAAQEFLMELPGHHFCVTKVLPIPESNISTSSSSSTATGATPEVEMSHRPSSSNIHLLSAKPAAQWSVEDVFAWLTAEGFEAAANLMQAEEIDGWSLLRLERRDLLLSPRLCRDLKVGPSIKLFEKIRTLQQEELQRKC